MLTFEDDGMINFYDDVTGRIMNKPGISKGGQVVIISDANRIRPRAYMHRHKLHVMPDDWTLTG